MWEGSEDLEKEREREREQRYKKKESIIQPNQRCPSTRVSCAIMLCYFDTSLESRFGIGVTEWQCEAGSIPHAFTRHARDPRLSWKP